VQFFSPDGFVHYSPSNLAKSRYPSGNTKKWTLVPQSAISPFLGGGGIKRLNLITSGFGAALPAEKLRGEHSESDQTTLNHGHALHPADQPATPAHRAWR